jgi:hypothetical protein
MLTARLVAERRASNSFFFEHFVAVRRLLKEKGTNVCSPLSDENVEVRNLHNRIDIHDDAAKRPGSI